MKINILEENILYIEDAIEDPYGLIKMIEDTEFEEHQSDQQFNANFLNLVPKWRTWYSSVIDENENIEDHAYGKQKFFNPQALSNFNSNDVSNVRHIINTMKMATKTACFEYRKHKGINEKIFIYPNFSINKYKTGAKMGPHADTNDGDKTLRFSLVTYLSDNHSGGELEFPNHNILFKPKAGSVIIFPSDQPYLHISHEVTDGWKYMSPSFWLNDPSKIGVSIPDVEEYDV